MNERLRLAGYGAAAVVLITLASFLTQYGPGTALMGSFLLSLFGLMFLTATSYEGPEGGGTTGPGSPAASTIESSVSVPYTEELRYAAAGACVASVAGTVLLMAV